jgi:hypothetical protein
MATIRARYAHAVHSGNLLVRSAKHTSDEAQTVLGDPEVLGAFGLADRNLTNGVDGSGKPCNFAPLAVPLERLFAGDTRAAHTIVEILAGMAFIEARARSIKLAEYQAHNMARAVLAWFRNGTCLPCGGRGFPTIKDSPVQSATPCTHCGEKPGKIPLLKHFRYEWKPLVLMLKDHVESESEKAGPAAMRTLAPRLEL